MFETTHAQGEKIVKVGALDQLSDIGRGASRIEQNEAQFGFTTCEDGQNGIFAGGHQEDIAIGAADVHLVEVTAPQFVGDSLAER